MFIISACLFVYQFNTEVLSIGCRVLNELWRCNLVSFKHVSLWCCFVPFPLHYFSQLLIRLDYIQSNFFRMTKTLAMVSHKNYNLSANHDVVIFLTSKLFHFENEVPINCLFTYWTYIYWILDLEDEVHLICVIWRSGLQECKGNFIFLSRAEWARSTGFIRAVKEEWPGQGPP